MSDPRLPASLPHSASDDEAIGAPVREWKQQAAICLHLARRELRLRYQASWLGLGWAVVYPLCMLAVYSLVFGIFLRVRWGDSAYDFVPALFCGLTTFGIFSATATRSATVVLEYRNHIRNSRFPAHMLSPMVLIGALVDAAIGFALLAAMNAVIFQRWSLHGLWLPVCLIPLVLLCLGITWGVSAVSVFVRDIASVVPILVNVLFFLSPVIYPVSAVPAGLQRGYLLNPLVGIVENVRRTAVWGVAPDWTLWAYGLVLSLIVFALGRLLFRHVQPHFADVL
jgi:lipopolysaccharide transport system permease protein